MRVLYVPRHVPAFEQHLRPNFFSAWLDLFDPSAVIDVLVADVQEGPDRFESFRYGGGTRTAFLSTARVRLSNRTLPWLWGYCRALRRGADRIGNRWDLVYAQESYPSGFAASRLASYLRIPMILHQHSLNSGYRSNRIVSFAHRGTLKAARDVIVPSRYLANDLNGVVGRKYRVVPNFVDVSRFQDVRGSSTSGGVRLVALGTFGPGKGLLRLLKALVILKREGKIETKLEVLGPVYDVQQREADEFLKRPGTDLEVSFSGLVSRDDVPARIAQSDILVLPSDSETFAMPVIEALASGVPVVATRCGGPEEILTPDLGVLTDRTEEDLAAGISALAGRLHATDRDFIRREAERRFGPAAVSKMLSEILKPFGPFSTT